MKAGIADLDDSEVRRRMPALDLIQDDAIQRRTARLTRRAPAYFWDAPASSSGYHHALCRGKHGLWLHTLMVSTVVERLIPSYVEQGLLEPGDADVVRAAAILHDQRKNGDPEDPSETSVSDHEWLMANVIAEESELPVEVADAVLTHMGPWYDGPAPTAPYQRLVHLADMVASAHTITAAIPAPAPAELQELGAVEADLDD